MEKLLQEQKCTPSQAGNERAQNFWNAILRACLSRAQKEAKDVPAPKRIADVEYLTLKSENEVLKSSLNSEKETGIKLGIRVNELTTENNHLKTEVDRLKTLLALTEGREKQLSDDETRTTVRPIPWSPMELVELQEKYSRQPGESEVEYVWRVSLTGGDRILLSEEEAEGYWGPGVFLTTTAGNHNYSLTARAAYWAGSKNPRERGEPLIINTTDFSDFAVSVQKAACIQAIYERDVTRKSPMLAPIDPARLTLLICGLPDSLKMHAANTQDRIKEARACNKGSHDSQSTGQDPVHIITWSEFVQEIVSYGRQMGWVSATTTPHSLDSSQRVRQISTPKPKFQERSKFEKERYHWWRKAIELGVPRQWLHGASTSDIRMLVQSLHKRGNLGGESLSVKKTLPHKESAPFTPEHGFIDLAEPSTKNTKARVGQRATLPGRC